MDNNIPTPILSTPPVPPPTQQPSEAESSKMLFWLIGGLIVIIILVGGIYWFLSNQQKSPATSQKPAPTARPVEEVDERDVERIEVGEIDAEFTPVDQDLQNL